MSNLSRDNHYLSQMYLEAWKNNDNKVEVYDLLVPNSRVPKWKPKSTKSIGSLDSIFVRLNNGTETDDIEKWFNEKYESPSKEALNHAINNEKITVEEWHHLIDFVACHIVRSPSFIIKILKLAQEKVPVIFQKNCDDISKMSAQELYKAIKQHKITESDKKNDDLFPIKFTKINNESNKTNLLIETMIGKQFYLYIMKYLLEETSKVFHNYKWGIITVDANVSLPTSDDPVICLNYRSEDNYNFGGGWGSKNSNILFPISPNKILYTQIEAKIKSRWILDYKTSMLLKKMIVEHSHRKIISNFKDPEIEKIKPRYVNLEEFLREKEIWKNFQKDYLEKEAEYIK